ncbi:hypothetical protein KKR91_13845 [Arthrobacter jiangjiafuii]|uniref:Uncharacterized protein n=1 Tax=Arthrobacter jiangjiafuii TaxID=2817475 RepID=A0A975R0L1_9MICC|nr:hypothetical protein [Arthrobacter jiangjiafuii]MBP3042736.1 hypothetical protein [Arthrobacter jiangjiafuii]QWC09546.1 hypothetical protein KKR91_13845 [Arthrobacter jiangjiafuii]
MKPGTTPEDARPRRTQLMRLRAVAAGSVLAAVSITGAGVAPALAQAAEPRSLRLPLALPASIAGAEPDAGASVQERLLGIRADLANAVAWGHVTQAQADGFYARMQSRIARGL